MPFRCYGGTGVNSVCVHQPRNYAAVLQKFPRGCVSVVGLAIGHPQVEVVLMSAWWVAMDRACYVTGWFTVKIHDFHSWT